MRIQMLAGTILKERYQIEEVVGNGGFATTYRGTDIQTQETVAVKECRHMKPEELLKIRGESEVLRELSDSAGITQIRDYIEEDDVSYIIMDFAEGVTLKAYIEQNGPLKAKQVLMLFTPMMKALAGIHAKELLHRDISPDNIMIDQNEQLTLLDFGAARSVAANDQKTITMILKPGYAPEEQYRSLEAQGTWTDVYALSATMYYCLTGTAPVDSLQRMYDDTLRSPSELTEGIPVRMERALMHGLELRAENRTATMEQLLKELTQADRRHPAKANSAKVKYYEPGGASASDHRISRKGRKKVSAGVIAAAATVLLLCIVGLYFSVNRGENESDGDDKYLYISDQLITDEDMRSYRRNDQLEDLTFSMCEIPDDMMRELSGLKSVTSMTFYDCYGFTSYEPLKDMEQLDSLCIGIYREDTPTFNGEAGFPDVFFNVHYLNLWINGFEGGAHFLTRFPQLEYLIIHNTGTDSGLEFAVDDLSFMSGMKNLEQFVINDIQVLDSDFSALKGCEQLSSINMDNTDIKNLDHIDEILRLYSLSVQNNRITTLEPLAGCKQLDSIDVSGNALTNLSGVERLQLYTLYASDNQITDVSALTSQRSLMTLDLENNQLLSLKGCEELTNLTDLNVSDNQLTDLTELKNCEKLEEFRVCGNDLSDIQVIGDSFSVLRRVDVSDNKLSDIRPLARCRDLEAVKADANELTSLKGLEAVEELYGISAYDNQINDISALCDHTKLQYIDLSGNQIKDLSPLQKLQGDDLVLFLEGNQIERIEILPKENTYRMISLYGNPLESYQTADRLLVESIYLPNLTAGGYEILQNGHMDTLYLVDVPSAQKPRLEREFEESGIDLRLKDTEEADADMQEIREVTGSL